MRLVNYNELLAFINSELVSVDIMDNLFIELENANDKRSKDKIKMDIINYCDKLINWWINHFFKGYTYIKDDIYMYMVEALIYVISKYDYTKSNNFYLFYSNVCYFRCIELLEKMNKNKCVSLNYNSVVDPLIDVEMDALDKIENENTFAKIEEIIDELPPTKRYVINSLFGIKDHDKKTIDMLANEFGVTSACIYLHVIIL